MIDRVLVELLASRGGGAEESGGFCGWLVVVCLRKCGAVGVELKIDGHFCRSYQGWKIFCRFGVDGSRDIP